MLNFFKVICENGDHWVTSMNCEIQEARKYFVNTYKVYENFNTGEETKTKIIYVIDLLERKDLLYCLRCEGKALGIGIDELDLFIELEDINRSKLDQWEINKKDILEKWEEYVRLILGYNPSNR